MQIFKLTIGLKRSLAPLLLSLLVVSCGPCCKEKINDSLLPQNEQLIEREAYVLLFSSQTKGPRWVLERLTLDTISGKTHRTDFKTDMEICPTSRVSPADYTNSGFSRGHMAAASNHAGSATECSQTFFMSNMVPQPAKFNSGSWNALEKHVQSTLQGLTGGDIIVVTGPAYIPAEESLSCQVINNNIWVPTHCFKVLLIRNAKGNVTGCEAFLLPNQQEKHRPYTDFITTLAELEKQTHLQFPSIYHQQERNHDQCSHSPCP